MGPGNDRGPRGEHVEDGPGDDHVVIEHDDGRDYDHAPTESMEKRTELLEKPDRS